MLLDAASECESHDDEPLLLPMAHRWTDERLRAMLEAATSFQTDLADLLAYGGLAAHRNVARPIILAALDRRLEQIHDATKALLNDPSWTGPHGRRPDRRFELRRRCNGKGPYGR